MKKPYEHKCIECGNVYYYRKLKFNGRCPVCRGRLLAKGYRFAESLLFGHTLIMIPDIPMPPVKPPKPSQVDK